MTPLLVECCRVSPDGDELRRLASGCADWPEFLESASWHSVTALAFWALNRSCPDAVPKEVHTRLRDGFRDGTRRNLLFAAELARVLQLFRQAGILAVPFKGPTLAWSLYEAPGLRYMSDLDVIVPEACADRALDLLLRSGYRQRHSNAGRRFFDREGESPLITTNGALALDLHWGLALDYFGGLDAARFLERLQPATVADAPVPTFQTEDLLTFLCVHGGKHGWPTLIGICDVARLMARCPVDWDLTMSRAEEMSVSRYLRLGIRLAVDVLGCEAPREVWRCIEADAVVERLAEKIRANLHGRHSFTLAELLGLQFRLLTSPADKLRIIGHYLRPNNGDWEAFRFPPSLFPLYYLLRPFRLVWDWGICRKA